MKGSLRVNVDFNRKEVVGRGGINMKDISNRTDHVAELNIKKPEVIGLKMKVVIGETRISLYL